MHDPSALAYAAFLYFIAPVGLAKLVLRASWRTILIAYAIWYGALLLFGLSAAPRIAEGMGWMMILAMFLTIPAVPIIVLLLRFARVR